MATIVKTEHIHTADGASRFRATATLAGAKRQRTIPHDYTRSVDAMHGLAAGTLAEAFGLVWDDRITHVHVNVGVHAFGWPEVQ